MSSIPKSDYLKVLLLFVLLNICSYSALKKFVFVDKSSGRALQVDYTACQKYDTDGDKADTDLFSSCKSVVSLAYEDAEEKCKGYIQQLSSCMQSKRSRCRNEHTNVDGCVNAIVTSKVEKWTASSWVFRSTWTAAEGLLIHAFTFEHPSDRSLRQFCAISWHTSS